MGMYSKLENNFMKTVSKSLDFMIKISISLFLLIYVHIQKGVKFVEACMEKLEVCKPTEFWLEIMTGRDHWVDIRMYWILKI